MLKNKITSTKKLLYIGGAIHEGQNIEGVDKTPDLIREANIFKVLLQKYKVQSIDLGNVSSADYKQQQVNQAQSSHKLRNLQLLDCLLGKINSKIVEGLTNHPDSFTLTIGGDHSVGTPTLHALNTIYKDLKVIWVDAHPDFINSEESQYPNYHGYPVSHVTGLTKLPGFNWLVNKIPYQNLVLIAIRDIDPDEWINLKKYNIKSFTMDHVAQLGIGQVINQSIKYLDPIGDKPFHISFDIDAIDPHYAFGTGTKFRGGLNPIQSNLLIRSIAHQRKLVGLDIMEINQKLEQEDSRPAYRGEHEYGIVSPTVGLGIDLIDSVFTQYFTL